MTVQLGSSSSEVPRIARMPKAVRTAQVIAVVFAVLGLLVVVTLLAEHKLGSAVRDAIGYLPTMVVGGLALRFGRGGERIRLCAIVVCVPQVVCGLLVKVLGLPPGPLASIAGVIVIVLLTRRSATEWFGGPHQDMSR